MNLLMSIKPEFVKRILAGEKLYEFRKTIFKQNVDKVFIYSTDPDKKIVGYFEVGEIIRDTPTGVVEFIFRSFGNLKKGFLQIL